MIFEIFLLVFIILVYCGTAIAIYQKFFKRCKVISQSDDDGQVPFPTYDPFPQAIPREFLKETSPDQKYVKIYASHNPEQGRAIGINIDDAFYGRRTPFEAVSKPFRDVGIVTAIKGDGTSHSDVSQKTFKLLRRDLDPLRDFFEYQIYDFKNDLTIPLGMNYTYLEDGDIIDRIAGKESYGKFKVKMFDKYEYIYT